MKAVLPTGFFVAAILFAASSAHAFQVSYSVSQTGDSGNFNFSGSNPTSLNEFQGTEVSSFQFTGSVNPDRNGLIGVQSGFLASGLAEFPGDFPEDFPRAETPRPMDNGGPVTDEAPPELPFQDFGFDTISIDTRAVGRFQTTAEITGLTSTNDVGFVQFDWVVTGISSIFVDGAQEAGGPGDISIDTAGVLATLDSGFGLIETFLHSPTPGADDSINDALSGVLQRESFLVSVDLLQLQPGEVPLFDLDFTLEVATALDITGTNLGGFVSVFDADFSNTATLTGVTVFDTDENVIEGASVVDVATGQSIVAASVPEPSAAMMLFLAGCVAAVGRRRIS